MQNHGGQIYLFNILGIERPVKIFKRLWELEGARISIAQFSYHTEE